MIYVIVVALIFAVIGFVRRARTVGVRTTLLDTIVAAAFGWLAGIFMGVGARVGMWSIPFFNGSESRFTFDGTMQVILVFSLYGIGLGILYELVFRKFLRESGLLFGILVTVCAWYPLGAAGVQQLRFEPPLLPLLLVTGAVTLLMFVPFAVCLEQVLERWHRWHDAHVIAPV
jgi:hypothetical protein